MKFISFLEETVFTLTFFFEKWVIFSFDFCGKIISFDDSRKELGDTLTNSMAHFLSQIAQLEQSELFSEKQNLQLEQFSHFFTF